MTELLIQGLIMILISLHAIGLKPNPILNYVKKLIPRLRIQITLWLQNKCESVSVPNFKQTFIVQVSNHHEVKRSRATTPKPDPTLLSSMAHQYIYNAISIRG